MTAAIVKILELSEQTLVSPLIEPGIAGAGVTATARVRIGDEPQALFAVTIILPPETPAVTVMEVVAELPVQPPGKTQV